MKKIQLLSQSVCSSPCHSEKSARHVFYFGGLVGRWSGGGEGWKTHLVHLMRVTKRYKRSTKRQANVPLCVSFSPFVNLLLRLQPATEQPCDCVICCPLRERPKRWIAEQNDSSNIECIQIYKFTFSTHILNIWTWYEPSSNQPHMDQVQFVNNIIIILPHWCSFSPDFVNQRASLLCRVCND